MAGLKLFTNTTEYHLSITLLVRASEDPRNQADPVSFELAPGQANWHEYGNDIDIYLNGINLISFMCGQMISQQQIVISRGSTLDDDLNTRNAVEFQFANGSFTIRTHQF